MSEPKQIGMFFHCKDCLEEYELEAAPGESRADFQKLEAGWTEKGVQVWCRRHDKNVIHIDFNMQKVGVR